MTKITKNNYIRYLNELENKYNGNIPKDNELLKQIQKAIGLNDPWKNNSSHIYDIYDENLNLVFSGGNRAAAKYLISKNVNAPGVKIKNKFADYGPTKIKFGNYFMLRKNRQTGKYVNGYCMISDKHKYHKNNVRYHPFLYRVYDQGMNEQFIGLPSEVTKFLAKNGINKSAHSIRSMSTRGSTECGQYHVIRVDSETMQEAHPHLKRRRKWIAFDTSGHKLISGTLTEIYYWLNDHDYSFEYYSRRVNAYGKELPSLNANLKSLSYFITRVSSSTNPIRSFNWGYIKKESELYD